MTEPTLECGMRPIQTGEILRDELAELGPSARAFARALGIQTNRVTQILNEQRGISADTALRLARYFGTTPEFGMDLQSDCELRRAPPRGGRRDPAQRDAARRLNDTVDGGTGRISRTRFRPARWLGAV
jgi:antitoxin HigA-1